MKQTTQEIKAIFEPYFQAPITSDKYIASYLGITPESLSRIRKKTVQCHFLSLDKCFLFQMAYFCIN